MTEALIYQPAKTAMQSGLAKTRRWKLEYRPSTAPFVEPLMGWVGQRDTQAQLNLWFETREAAVAYAQEQGINYRVTEPHPRRLKPKSYADNFRFQQERKRS